MKNKKKISVLMLSTFALVCFTSGVFASSSLTKITAYINSAISVELFGKPLNLGDAKPITYNNTTYLPLRTVAQATGLDVKWNQKDQLVSLSEPILSGQKNTINKNKVTIVHSLRAELLLNPKGLTFTNQSYKEVVEIPNVDSIGTRFEMILPNGTKKVGLTMGSEVEKETSEITYRVYDEDKNVLSKGIMNNNSTTTVEFLLSNAGTTITIEFSGALLAKDTAYVVLDDSWFEL